MFNGSKAAVFVGSRLLCILRDDRSDIGHPNQWDFPGGGREGNESPTETLVREIQEEVSLVISPGQIVWEASGPSAIAPGKSVHFFVVRLPEGAQANIALGDEGQEWRLMTVAEFLNRHDAVPSLQVRLRRYLDETGGMDDGR